MFIKALWEKQRRKTETELNGRNGFHSNIFCCTQTRLVLHLQQLDKARPWLGPIQHILERITVFRLVCVFSYCLGCISPSTHRRKAENSYIIESSVLNQLKSMMMMAMMLTMLTRKRRRRRPWQSLQRRRKRQYLVSAVFSASWAHWHFR